MKTLAALLMLCAVEAHAATFFYDFARSPSQMAMLPCNLITDVHGPVTRGGITATFGDGWAFGIDCDDWPLADCLECPYRAEDRLQNNYANPPSPGGVMANCPHVGESAQASIITFNPPVRFVSFWYSRAAYTTRLYATDCSFYLESDARPFYFRFYTQPNTFPTVAEMDLTGTGGGVEWEQGCSGDPNGEYCGWTYVEMVVPANKPAVTYVGIEPGLDPLYIDNLTAATGDCPNPPCEFERADAPREEVTPAQRTSWGQLKVLYR